MEIIAHGNRYVADFYSLTFHLIIMQCQKSKYLIYKTKKTIVRYLLSIVFLTYTEIIISKKI